MSREYECEIGERVRIKRILNGETKYIWGKVVSRWAERVVGRWTEDSSPYYENVYQVELEDNGDVRIFGYMRTYNELCNAYKEFICPVPSIEQVIQRTDNQIDELQKKIKELSHQIETLKGYKFDVISGKIPLDAIDYYM